MERLFVFSLFFLFFCFPFLPEGYTAFLLAVEKGNVKAIQALAAAKANPNIPAFDKTAPLIKAVQCKASAEIVAAILKAGADVNCSDKLGQTPLLSAGKILAMSS
jgi:ankyrin repeat protein